MSGTVTQDPLMKSAGPFSYGDKRTLGYDFTNLLLTGETINPSTIVVSSSPPGFSFGTPSVSGNVVMFAATAPTAAGVYIVSVTIDTQGLPTTQHITRSASIFVLQR